MSPNIEEKREANKNKACMMEYGDSLVCVDPSLTTLGLIGKKYTMMIIGVIGNEGNKKNFNEVVNDIPFSSRTIIAKRLREMQQHGLIEKANYDRRINYSLTPLGVKVRDSLLPLLSVLEAWPK